MYNAPDVSSLLHDRQVEQHLAGPLAVTGDLVAFHVDDAQVRRLHKALGDHRRCAENLIGSEAVRDVTVVASGEAFVVDATANVADFFLQFREGLGCHCACRFSCHG